MPSHSDAVDAARSRPDRACSSSVAHCQTASIRFIFDNGDDDTGNDRELRCLNISNLVTSDNLPSGFGPDSDGSADPDHFKIEINDTGKSGSTISSGEVRLEILKPDGEGGYEAFSPVRRLQVECRRVSGSTGSSENKYRSRYLRLVTDTEDRNANSDQCLLADWDPDHPEIEILDQIVRASYTASTGDRVICTAAVGEESQKRRLKLAVHIVRTNPGVAGSGVVTINDATTRVNKWFRRVYAQTNTAPRLMQAVDEVDPPRNMLIVSDNSGANAAGNVNNRMRFFIQGIAGITYTVRSGDTFVIIAENHGIPEWRTIYNHAENADFRLRRPNPNVIYPGDEMYIPAHGGRVAVVYYPPVGASPMQTAQALAERVRTANLEAEAFQNAPRPGDAAGSADLLIRRDDGSMVTLEDETSNDTAQSLRIARVSTADFMVSSNDSANGFATHNIGTGEQRSLVRNFRNNHNDRIECFVLGNTVRYDNDATHTIRGRAVLPGLFQPAAWRPIAPLLRSIYLMDETMESCNNTAAGDSADRNPFTFPHECGHVAMDVYHADQINQMMKSGTSGTNGVNESKRIYDSEINFPHMGAVSPLNQVNRLRSSGGPVLENW